MSKLSNQQLLALRIANSRRAARVYTALKNAGWEASYQISLGTGLVGAMLHNLTEKPELLAASTVAALISKLGPKAITAVERMKINNNQEYYHQKVMDLGLLYAQQRIKLSEQKINDNDAKSSVRQILKEASSKLGFDNDSRFYRDCISRGAELLAATKVNNPAKTAEMTSLAL